jgi:ABC-type nitrate/sulfonate/bicarbonate transport system permease component
MRQSAVRYLALLASLLLFVVIWWLAAAVSNNPTTVPGPQQTWGEFTRLFSDVALSS